MIPFNVLPYTGCEEQFINNALNEKHLSDGGPYVTKCESWLENRLDCKKTLMTPSCTHALEMAAHLIDVQPGDEILMPSFTFVSTANPFVLRGANIVFIDVKPETMNINEALVKEAITSKTKAIVPVHYGGVACEMNTIMSIAKKYNLYVIEDAAQGIEGTYNGYHLGTLGHIGTYSFHETKNISSGGEGGLILLNDAHLIERAEIIREKGTNRSKFFRGEVDKYSWVDIGSSYLPSGLQAAYLWGQLQYVQDITKHRLDKWHYYYNKFSQLKKEGAVELPEIPYYAQHNAHLFYLKLPNHEQSMDFVKHLKKNNIDAKFHYVPLHISQFGKLHGRFFDTDVYTTIDSKRLVRLPLYYPMRDDDLSYVVQTIFNFFN